MPCSACCTHVRPRTLAGSASTANCSRMAAPDGSAGKERRGGAQAGVDFHVLRIVPLLHPAHHLRRVVPRQRWILRPVGHSRIASCPQRLAGPWRAEASGQAVAYGSSLLRPYRGSRMMLMFGPQPFKPMKSLGLGGGRRVRQRWLQAWAPQPGIGSRGGRGQ